MQGICVRAVADRTALVGGGSKPDLTVPDDAGGFAQLATRREAVAFKVRSDRDVPENVAFLPSCYAEAAANLLTNPARDPAGKTPEFKFCAVRLPPVG